MSNFEEAFDDAYRLVGKLMNAYAQIEYELTVGIHRVYRLHWAEGNILTASMPFGNKSSCLRAALKHYHADRLTREWFSEADKIFDRIDEDIRGRNMVAHTYFEPDGAGGVSFIKSGTRKQYSQTIISKSPKIVDDEFDRLADLAYALQQLVSEATWKEGQYLPPREPNGKLDPLTPLFQEACKHNPPQQD